ncbi:SWIM zinc finger domain-containing protein [Actinoplanes sp. NPDC051513]|uniref:SWIM zinc finger domain-containing protein n=1 Tax=Actinoplanes sp. NPDC051513 TaxID=3363908 RepID=UPI0037B83A68
MAWLTDVVLRRRAGATVYQRGGYLVGAVADLVEQPDAVTAMVASSGSPAVRYRVCLQRRGGEPVGECDCPQGLEGHFCKHCVAVGLRVVNGVPPDRPAAAPPGPAAEAGPDEQWSAVQAYVDGCTRQELVELLRDAARDDAALRHRLWVLASASEPEQLRARTERLGEGYAAIGGAAFAEQARAVVFALSHLPAARAGIAHELLPSVLRYLLAALDGAPDDSYAAEDVNEYAVDHETPVIDAVGVAWRTYLVLCGTVPPGPAAFAAWFVELRLAHPMYRHRLPASDLAGLTGLLAACQSRLDGYEGDAAAVWSLTDEVLQAIGDTDAYVAFLAGDLSTYQRYARIAEVLVAAGCADEAVTWLERARHPEVPLRDPASPVVELLARLYTRQDRLAEALEVRRRHFTATRTEAAYRALKQAADRAGVNWTPLRAGVLDLLRRDTPRLSGGDTLVRILLAEGEPDEAWATARRYGCESHTLVMAAKARAVNHPVDAIDVYWNQIEEALVFHDRDRNRAYERVVNLLLILRDLVTRAGGDFGAELARFKATHRRKRNLMDELARRGL